MKLSAPPTLAQAHSASPPERWDATTNAALAALSYRQGADGRPFASAGAVVLTTRR
jgi:hypothetical protein